MEEEISFSSNTNQKQSPWKIFNHDFQNTQINIIKYEYEKDNPNVARAFPQKTERSTITIGKAYDDFTKILANLGKRNKEYKISVNEQHIMCLEFDNYKIYYEKASIP